MFRGSEVAGRGAGLAGLHLPRPGWVLRRGIAEGNGSPCKSLCILQSWVLFNRSNYNKYWKRLSLNYFFGLGSTMLLSHPGLLFGLWPSVAFLKWSSGAFFSASEGGREEKTY